MDIDTENINVNEFVPATKQNKSSDVTHTKGKKRAISEGEQMQVDEVSGIEGGAKKNTPKTKRKRHANLEVRKIPVPAHRFVYTIFITCV